VSDLIREQQPPRPGTGDVWQLVLADMEARRLEGIRRYGTPLQPHNGRDALVDLYQELLDATAYCRQALAERHPPGRPPLRSRVYVAGPISKGDLRENIRRALEAGHRLLKAGYSPLVPHLTCWWGGETPEVLPRDTVIEDWYGMELSWVAVAHAVLRLPGESTGAGLEVQLAADLRIPVFRCVEELMRSVPPTVGGPP
jgi:hypothetical protein